MYSHIPLITLVLYKSVVNKVMSVPMFQSLDASLLRENDSSCYAPARQLGIALCLHYLGLSGARRYGTTALLGVRPIDEA